MGPPLQRCARGAACCGAPFWETPWAVRHAQWAGFCSGAVPQAGGWIPVRAWAGTAASAAGPFHCSCDPAIRLLQDLLQDLSHFHPVRARARGWTGTCAFQPHTNHNSLTHSHTTPACSCNQALVVAWTFLLCAPQVGWTSGLAAAVWFYCVCRTSTHSLPPAGAIRELSDTLSHGFRMLPCCTCE